MKGLTWTFDKPTKPGLYVWTEDDREWFDLLRITKTEELDMDGNQVADMDAACWNEVLFFGPIPEPPQVTK